MAYTSSLAKGVFLLCKIGEKLKLSVRVRVSYCSTDITDALISYAHVDMGFVYSSVCAVNLALKRTYAGLCSMSPCSSTDDYNAPDDDDIKNSDTWTHVRSNDNHSASNAVSK